MLLCNSARAGSLMKLAEFGINDEVIKDGSILRQMLSPASAAAPKASKIKKMTRSLPKGLPLSRPKNYPVKLKSVQTKQSFLAILPDWDIMIETFSFK
jgi:hypothetical protein